MPTPSELLSAIAAAPDDDGPRWAYAERLLEDGLPLGRFIAAQLRGDDDTAVEHLAAAVAATGLPTLAPPPYVAFRRGFLSVCLTSGDRALEAVEAPGWALVEDLRLAEPQAAEFIHAVGSRLASLKALEAQSEAAAVALAGVRPKPLGRLTIQVVRHWFEVAPLVDDQTVVALGVAGAFEVQREGSRVHLSPSAYPFQEERVAPALRALVRPDDEVVFVFMGDREPVEATRRALESIPHRRFAEHELAVVGVHRS